MNYAAVMLTAFKSASHMLSRKAAYNVLFSSVVMFPHELKIEAFLIIYCHWERCFGWLPTVPATLALKHPPVHWCVQAGPTPVKAVIEGRGASMMIHSQKSLI